MIRSLRHPIETLKILASFFNYLSQWFDSRQLLETPHLHLSFNW